MQTTNITARERIGTQDAPMNEDTGRLVANEAIQFAAIAGAALCIGAVCVLVATAALVGGDSYEWGIVRLLRSFGLLFGTSGAIVCYGFAGVVSWLTIRGWIAYQQRLANWHTAHLAAYKLSGGQQRERELTIRTMTLAEPLHVLAVALAVVERHREDGSVTWSGPALRGEVWIGRLRMGDLGKNDSEQFSAALATLGIVKGRKAGAAGQLVTKEPAEVIDLVKRNFGKLRPGEVVRAEVESYDS
jgi:hypothetical protein